MNSSLRERIRAAARLGRESADRRPGFEEVEPGVRMRALGPCRHRGAEKDRREVPCCGGRVRREVLFACGHPGNARGEAWSIMCQGCILDGEEVNGGETSARD